MATPNLVPLYGTIQYIYPVSEQCCNTLVSMRMTSDNSVANFIVSPDTYVIDSVRLRLGMNIAAFYDADRPVPLIYPPQYQAAVIGQRNPRESVVYDYFDSNLVSSNQSLKLNIANSTEIVTANGQRFTCGIQEQYLIVYYSETTRSIPPQTTPRKVIVLC